MERPAKKMRLEPPSEPSWRLDAQQNTAGFETVLRARSDGISTSGAVPTRTINLSEFQRRAMFREDQRKPRQILPRRNAGIYLFPRVPEATVTANVVEININDGTKKSTATVVAVSAGVTVVSLENIGSLTLPAVSVSVKNPVTAIMNPLVPVITKAATITTSTQPLLSSRTALTSTNSLSPSVSLSDGLSPAASVLSAALNGTMTTSSEHTVTMTATSTFDISLSNGTLIAPSTSIDTATETGEQSSTSNVATFTTSYQSGSQQSGIVAGASESQATSTAYQGYAASAVGGTTAATTTPAAAAATSDSSSSSGIGSPLSPAQQQVVGGVVGGVAGIAIILVLLLVILRWYRRRLKARGELPEQIAERRLTGGPNDYQPRMSQRSSVTPLVATLASNLRNWRPLSNQTTGTHNTALSIPDSERSFQRVAGRKIAPVLTSGGDGWGGSYGAFEQSPTPGPMTPLSTKGMTLAGASFYKDDKGFYGGHGATSPSPQPYHLVGSDHARTPSPIGFGPSKPDGMAVLRPSPARTPVTLSPAASNVRLPMQNFPTMDDDVPPIPTNSNLNVPAARDAVGRSLAVYDGSFVSNRSKGSARSKFAENIS